MGRGGDRPAGADRRRIRVTPVLPGCLRSVARAANIGGSFEELANREARTVTVRPPHVIPTRYLL